MQQNDDQRVLMGRVGAPYGVKGWVWIYSDTRPMDNILDYELWQLEQQGRWQTYEVLQARPQGKALIAQLADVQGNAIADRDQAASLTNAQIGIWRHELPALPEGEYYWADLIGLSVLTESGQPLGKVKSLMETGANNVLVVDGDRERLIPFVMDQVIRKVDLPTAEITVDWDPDF